MANDRYFMNLRLPAQSPNLVVYENPTQETGRFLPKQDKNVNLKTTAQAWYENKLFTELRKMA